MNVLVIAPHPDDESIGCGGAVALHAERGDRITPVFLTSGELGLKQLTPQKARRIREAEGRSACEVLGMDKPKFLRLSDWMMGDNIDLAAAKLAPLLRQFAPRLIYLPHPKEWHPDHKASLPVLRAALQLSRTAEPALRGYEIWTPLAEYHHVENISKVMPTKLHALRKHVSQLKEWDYVRAVKGLSAYRGAMAGRCRYAEVFQELSRSV